MAAQPCIVVGEARELRENETSEPKKFAKKFATFAGTVLITPRC